MGIDRRYETLIVGGGTAGITVAARLHRAGMESIALIDPSDSHFYQPLWTLVGGGRAPAGASLRPMSSVIPAGVDRVKDSVTSIDPDGNAVETAGGTRIGYGRLVVCPGIQLDWRRIPGMADALNTPMVSSNYRFDLTGRTWAGIQQLRSGTAVFTMPAGPIKCGGAPQKIAYLAADHWRRQGVLGDIRVVLVLPTPAMFTVPVFAEELTRVANGYGIEVRLDSEAVEIDPGSRQVVVADHKHGTKETIAYDFMHVVPPQSAPDWIKAGPLADPDNPGGYVSIDRHTMRHTRYPDVFALGDVVGSPNSKTGAAIRRQAPVVVANLRAAASGKRLDASYDGYSSCPLVTARNKMLLAEFDYSGEPTPSFPFINTRRERRDMWLLKRYGLPYMYWHLMLKGRA